MKPILLIAVLLALVTGCESPPAKVAPMPPDRGPIRVLCLASEDTIKQGMDHLDPRAVKAYREAGFELTLDYYQRVTPEQLSHYPVVIGMIPMLHAGTRAISAELGQSIADYVDRGGGFLLIPAPAYYGGNSFGPVLNPWLKQFGVRLLSEGPRDPDHQRVIQHVLAYRYLRADALPHPVTAGIDHVWLPIDYSDSYVRTHTMKVSRAWRVLVRGSETCRTYTTPSLQAGDPKPGHYRHAPPFLALRDWGQGRLAVFTTASRYWVWDAYHPAHGNGFVLEQGGLQLMTNLLRYLAANAPPTTPPAPVAEAPVIHGNVDVCVDRAAWLQRVQERYRPPGTHVTAYVDCGAMSDLPWTAARGIGYEDTPHTNWLIRWPWSERWHVTAANARGFDRGTLGYRFDGLDSATRYRLGVLVWGYQDEGARDIAVTAEGQPLGEPISLPRFSQKQGPRFVLLDVPPAAIAKGSFRPQFSLAPGGSGTFSSICELWLFAGGDAPPLTPGAIDQRWNIPPPAPVSIPYPRIRLSGLIGARSPASGGEASVAELCDAASKAGLDFLVFTDDVSRLNQRQFDALQAACAAASHDGFQAVHGVQFTAAYADPEPTLGNPRARGGVTACVFGEVQRLPDRDLLGNPHELMWKFFGGEYCGGHRTEPTIVHPGINGISPFYQRFWRGLDVMTFDAAGRNVDDARALYADLLASGYGPRPRVAGVYRTPDDIRRAAAGWRVWIEADKLENLVPYAYTSTASSGPEFTTLAWENDHMRWGSAGEGLLFRGHTWLYLHLAVKAKSPLSRVTLWRDRTPIRVWSPHTPEFAVTEPILVTGQHELHVVADDTAGGQAVSGRFQTQDLDFAVGMCGDNQNTITNLFRPPAAFERRENDMYLAHSYWHTGEGAGQLGVMLPAGDLVPRIIETGIIQPVKHFHPCPRLVYADGAAENHLRSELRIMGSSSDYYQLEYRFDQPGSRATSLTTLTAFRPVEGGATAVAIESVLTPRQPLALAAEGDELPLRLLSLALMPTLPAQWRYTVADGQGGVTATGAYADLVEPRRLRLPARGSIVLWPNEMGSLLVQSMNSRDLDLQLLVEPNKSRAREYIELGDAAGPLADGQPLTTRLLVAWVPGHIGSDSAAARLPAPYRAGYLHDVTASNGLATGVHADGGDLRLRVAGLNPNWSIIACQDGVRWRPVTPNQRGDRALVLFPAAATGTAWQVGHPVIAGDSRLQLEWAGLSGHGIRLHAHNPSTDNVRTTLATNSSLPGIPAATGQVTLAPGESIWLTGTAAGFTREEPPQP